MQFQSDKFIYNRCLTLDKIVTIICRIVSFYPWSSKPNFVSNVIIEMIGICDWSAQNLLRPFNFNPSSQKSILDLLVLNQISKVFCVEILVFFSKNLIWTLRPYLHSLTFCPIRKKIIMFETNNLFWIFNFAILRVKK